MPKTRPSALSRVTVGALTGVLIACTTTVVTVQAAAVAPRLEAPMQRLNVGQDQHSAFPGMARLRDGSLRLVWRQGTDHYLARDGRIMLAESHDDGATWENVQTIRMNPDYRDPSLSSIDGIEYLSWFGGSTNNEAMGAGVMRLWGPESRRIDTAQYGAMSAPIVKLPDGRFGAAFYARNPGESLYTAWMGWSWDSWTWSTNRIVNLLGSGTATPEPYLVVNGSWTHMLFRWGADALGIRSTPDSGTTWQPARKILENATGRPTTIAVNGTLIVVYREASTKNAVMAYSRDNGQSWQPAGTVLGAPAGSPNGMTYATMVAAQDPGKIRLVVGMEQSDGSSDLWGGTVDVP